MSRDPNPSQAKRVADVLRESEAERRRLAELLNGEPVQVLAHISRTLQSLEGGPGTPTAVTRTARVAGLQAAAVSEQLRGIARLLRPSVLDDIGLEAALRQLASEFAASSGVVIESDLNDVRDLRGSETDIALYRVAESALRNATEQAVTTVRMRLAQRSGHIILTVQDNGTMAHHQVEASTARLSEMAEWMRSVHGWLRVRSRADTGTVVVAAASTTTDAPPPRLA